MMLQWRIQVLLLGFLEFQIVSGSKLLKRTHKNAGKPKKLGFSCRHDWTYTRLCEGGYLSSMGMCAVVVWLAAEGQILPGSSPGHPLINGCIELFPRTWSAVHPPSVVMLQDHTRAFQPQVVGGYTSSWSLLAASSK